MQEKILRKRKAVYEALKPFLNDSVLATAMNLWQNQYETQQGFALQHFLRDLCEGNDLSLLRSRMLQSLIRAFSELQDNEITQQRKILQAKERSFVKTHAVQNAEFSMFVDLVENLIDYPGNGLVEKIRLQILQNFQKLSSVKTQRWQLHAWLSKQEALSPLHLTLNAKQDIINLVYVALCDYLGPVKADQVMQVVIADVQKNYPNLNVSELL